MNEVHAQRHRPGPPTAGRHGFSLAEIVIVIVIITTLAWIAQPRFSGYVQRDRLRRAAQRVQMDLRVTQQEAMRRRAPAGITFSPANDFYACWYWNRTLSPAGWSAFANAAVLRACGAACDEASMSTALGADPDYQVTIESTGFTGDTITFDLWGVPDAGGDIVLGSANGRITITVDPVSGAASVSDPTEVGSPSTVVPSRPAVSDVVAIRPAG
ncbi:MAG: prepilin-type N-terminal cleavage/methylation domain-containing protein [Phycisphaerales bacterium]|nr:MAG: prepilin-type N-terminal cleavage/methylation domain-containing protein [Phycisphaerales bacterium]